MDVEATRSRASARPARALPSAIASPDRTGGGAGAESSSRVPSRTATTAAIAHPTACQPRSSIRATLGADCDPGASGVTKERQRSDKAYWNPVA